MKHFGLLFGIIVKIFFNENQVFSCTILDCFEELLSRFEIIYQSDLFSMRLANRHSNTKHIYFHLCLSIPFLIIIFYIHDAMLPDEGYWEAHSQIHHLSFSSLLDLDTRLVSVMVVSMRCWDASQSRSNKVNAVKIEYNWTIPQLFANNNLQVLWWLLHHRRRIETLPWGHSLFCSISFSRESTTVPHQNSWCLILWMKRNLELELNTKGLQVYWISRSNMESAAVGLFISLKSLSHPDSLFSLYLHLHLLFRQCKSSIRLLHWEFSAGS